MKKNKWRVVQRMSKYLSENYSAGSILERANYKRDKKRPYKICGSIIEQKIQRKEHSSVWQKIRKIIKK